jgi:hypothetical protein
MEGDNFWGDEITILFDKNRSVEFYPSQDMTKNEKLNSIARFSIYLGGMMTLFKKDPNYLSITLIGLLITYLIYTQTIQIEFLDEDLPNKFTGFLDKRTRKPTKENPFMNVVITDFGTGKDPAPAADISNKEIKEEMTKNFEKGLYIDANDYFSNQNNQRQFYTFPSTTIPNDRASLANWLFKKETSCKEDNDCKIYNDLRQQSNDNSFVEDPTEELRNQFQKLNTRSNTSW